MKLQCLGMPEKGGYIFTITMVLLCIPLVLLVMFYISGESQSIEDSAARIRCDSLYYFVQDVEYDLSRAMDIFGRRAAIYAIDDFVTTNNSFANYSYTDCGTVLFSGNGSEAALAELMACGTLYGENVTYMVNHTIPIWLERINDNGIEMGYSTQIFINGIEVVPKDAWNFATIINASMEVTDSAGLCRYTGLNFTLSSETSILGLEDPLFATRTSQRASKYFWNCSLNISPSILAGCSSEDWGEDVGAGKVVFYSNIMTSPGLGTFCSSGGGNGVVLAIDDDLESCSGIEYNCFDATSSDKLSAVVIYSSDNPETGVVSACNITIPWISATGKIDEETPYGTGWARLGSPCNQANLFTSACAYVRNIGDCDVHDISVLGSASTLGGDCYTVSEASLYSDTCGDFPDGPSFFDRLDGNLYLSDKYKNQAEDNFGDGNIGIETLVSLPALVTIGLDVDEDASWVDYLYWNGTPGCASVSNCQDADNTLILDCAHAHSYGIDTLCINGSGIAPAAEISIPGEGDEYPLCPTVNISGMADDCDGEIVKVEVDYGEGWEEANYESGSWYLEFSPNVTNSYDIVARATDSSGIIGLETDSVRIYVTGCASGDNVSPGAPSLIRPIGGENLGSPPELAWSAPYDLSGICLYEVAVIVAGGDWESPIEEERLIGRVYEVTETLPVGTYSWHVCARDCVGNWGNFSEANFSV